MRHIRIVEHSLGARRMHKAGFNAVHAARIPVPLCIFHLTNSEFDGELSGDGVADTYLWKPGMVCPSSPPADLWSILHPKIPRNSPGFAPAGTPICFRRLDHNNLVVYECRHPLPQNEYGNARGGRQSDLFCGKFLDICWLAAAGTWCFMLSESIAHDALSGRR